MNLNTALSILKTERDRIITSYERDDFGTRAISDALTVVISSLEKRGNLKSVFIFIFGLVPFMTFTAAAVYLIAHGMHYWAGFFVLLILLTLPRFR